MREKAGLKKIWGILILFLLVLLPGQIAFAKEIKPVKIDEKHFPDENLRWEISESFDKNKDGILSKKEIRKAKELEVLNYSTLKRSLNFSGIEYLPYIKKIGIYSYKIKQKDLNRYPFTKAKKIELSNNHMKSMDFSACKELEELECSNNNVLQEITVKKNKKLKRLDLEACHRLKKLDISKNDKLERIRISENKTKGGFLLKGAKKLKVIKLFNSKLSGVRIENCPKVKEVDITYSTTESLVLKKCPVVNKIDLSETSLNRLSVSQPDALTTLIAFHTNLNVDGIKQYKNLKELSIGDTSLLELNANLWPKLKRLSVSGCLEMTKLDVGSLDDLEHLDAEYTRITALDLSGKYQLKELTCFNYLEEINLTGVTNLKKVLTDKRKDDGNSILLQENPLKRIILDKDISQTDLEYINEQIRESGGGPELVFV